MSNRNIQVEALAGTGKTFTLLEGMSRMVTGRKTDGVKGSDQQEAIWEAFGDIRNVKGTGQGVLFAAFNKAIATELAGRVPFGSEASTLHAFGFRAVKAVFGDKLRGRNAVNGFRTQNLAEKLYGVDFRTVRRSAQMPQWQEIFNLVGLCKQTLSDGSPESIKELQNHYGFEIGNETFTLPKVSELLEASKEVTHEIDFNDMIWLPVVCDLPVPRRKVLLVDEAQDLNLCQQALAVRSADRLIVCGDANQSIYGFAGADAESMNRLKGILGGESQFGGHFKAGVEVFPLTVTRRCPKAVTKLAQEIVPAFECLPDAEEGTVDSMPVSEARKQYSMDDMILCRVNAPLIAEAFKMIRANVPCRIQGRDFGKTLTAFVEKLMKIGQLDADDSASDLAAEAEAWRIKETDRLSSLKNCSQTRIDQACDQADCVIDSTENSNTCGEVLSRFETLFADEGRGKVVLSSVHRSKGLEAERIFILHPEKLPLVRKKMKAWEQGQERNLQYVAYTRAMKHLTFCESETVKRDAYDGEPEDE